MCRLGPSLAIQPSAAFQTVNFGWNRTLFVLVVVTHDLLFTFPFLFRSLSLYRPLPFVPPFLVLFVSSSRPAFVSLQSLPFVSVRSCSCLAHELDLSALAECRVGKAELPNYLWDQGPVIEFWRTATAWCRNPGPIGEDRQNEFELIGAARYRWRRWRLITFFGLSGEGRTTSTRFGRSSWSLQNFRSGMTMKRRCCICLYS